MTGFPFLFFLSWMVFSCVYFPHLLYPFIHWWTIKLILYLGYWVTLQWTWDCRCLFHILISFPLNIYEIVGLVAHMVVIFSNVLRTLHTVFHNGYNYIATNSVQSFSFLFSASSPTLLFCLFDNSHSNKYDYSSFVVGFLCCAFKFHVCKKNIGYFECFSFLTLS